MLGGHRSRLDRFTVSGLKAHAIGPDFASVESYRPDADEFDRQQSVLELEADPVGLVAQRAEGIELAE